MALLTSGSLWLTSAQVLANDDPYEGMPGAIQFPHRMWKSIDEVPPHLRARIIATFGEKNESPEVTFKKWFMIEEQSCIMNHAWRRSFYVNCWHGAAHESVAMWKIYGSPGVGVAIVSNNERIERALSAAEEKLYLGQIAYHDPSFLLIGAANAFETLMIKRSSFEYEREVRLVYWGDNLHDPFRHYDPVNKATWNEERMRYDNLTEDTRAITPGISVACDIDVMIEKLIISPFAPPWYASMIEQVRERLGYRFTVQKSQLLDVPTIIP